MTDQANRPKPGKALQAAALAHAACRIVERDGLAGLTLRPLADELGVSVSVLTNRHGSRDGVVAAVCAAAREQDALLLDEWRALLARVGSPTAGLAAELSEALLDDLGTRARPLSLLFLELLHASGGDDALRAAFLPWAEERGALWDALATDVLPPSLRDWWNGYMLAELAYGLVLNPLPAHGAIMREATRLVEAGKIKVRLDPTTYTLA